MQHEITIQKKKSYVSPTMEVVELEHQVSLLEGSGDLPYPTCDNPPCRFD